jgi:hypothetical protein
VLCETRIRRSAALRMSARGPTDPDVLVDGGQGAAHGRGFRRGLTPAAANDPNGVTRRADRFARSSDCRVAMPASHMRVVPDWL